MLAVREARTIGVCLVSQDDGLAQDLGAVLDTLNNLLRGTGAGILSEAPKIDLNGLYRQVLFQASRYLQSQADGAAPLSLELQCFSSIPAAKQALGVPERQACTECVLLDARNDDPDVAGDPFLPLTGLSHSDDMVFLRLSEKSVHVQQLMQASCEPSRKRVYSHLLGDRDAWIGSQSDGAVQ